MSEHPLKPANTVCIVLGANLLQINDALLQYGPDEVALMTVYKITYDAVYVGVLNETSSNSAIAALPSDTPWCVLPSASESMTAILTGYFGPPLPLSKCLDMRNQDYAIHPSRFK